MELREELSKFLEKYEGYKVSSGEIIITVGGTGALDLLGRVLIDPGDIVITGNPRYINSILSFEQLGAKIVGIPMNENGMRTDLLEEKLKELEARGRRSGSATPYPPARTPWARL
ncbi:aminotransferase class I/II-fold pyridoxal phosphate-dependent enzyme [Thermococcus piezophilus]|uniref:aminotransferase class I/II-fold pyridoxal phosphate-dependent enzyme n=1 Tax=Thermococcus piezophilus TaxID=1712654 RepID=UPI0022772886|nr:aminotransferase class I/II-fold pyridoxal phosphate-dependent enzyme [Thermococcus piezophilus]